MTQPINKQPGREESGPEQSAAESRASATERGRERARVAWRWVAEVEGKPDCAERYGTLARKLPSYLQVSGLGQTLAFLLSKSKPNSAEETLFQQITKYMGAEAEATRSMSVVLDMTPADYRRATRDMMLVAEWLKRFAEGKLGQKEE